MATTEPIRNKRQVWELTNYHLHRGELRNHCLIVLGVYTTLRISDLLRLKWDDVYDFSRRRVCEGLVLIEKKTGKTKVLALNESVKRALNLYAVQAARPGSFIIENIWTGRSISRVQAYRIIRAAAEELKLGSRISCHSLRKTFGYHAWKGGVSPAVIMEIYNHSSFDVTKRYLGVTQDDKNEVYMFMDFSA
jgi:integrase